MKDPNHSIAGDIEASLSSEGFEAKHAVKLVNVSRTYEIDSRRIEALRSVDLVVDVGEYVAVHGPSGSGKTTLLNIIGGLDRPTSGKVFVMDVPLNDYDESFRANFRLINTGFIFQSYNLISTFTALENVMFPIQVTGASTSEARRRAVELLQMVRMETREDHLPWQLSSGEQQRVAIARAIANDPPLILADEPTANLDVDSAASIRDLLSSLNTQGKTVIVMTHDEKIIRRDGAVSYRLDGGVLTRDV
ncbi:MAG: ABC transporter ATP-binding protein [Candidatus Thorarchaeota archaeon]